MPGPKPSGIPRRKPLGVALRPQVISDLEVLVERFQEIHQELAKKGVSIPDFPTTRSSVAAWLMEEGLRRAIQAMDGIERIRTNNIGTDDIAIVETSLFWHRVLHHWPRKLSFPQFPKEPIRLEDLLGSEENA